MLRSRRNNIIVGVLVASVLAVLMAFSLEKMWYMTQAFYFDVFTFCAVFIPYSLILAIFSVDLYYIFIQFENRRIPEKWIT